MFDNASHTFPGYKTSSDLVARQFLKKIVGDFSKILGEPEQEKQRFIFKINKTYLKNIQVYYEVDKKFLGNIYSLIFEGCIPLHGITGKFPPLHLSYSGTIKKGRPFFDCDKKEGVNPLARKLNKNEKLLNMCWQQDLEYLKIFKDLPKDVCRILYRPFGGSFVSLLFPPVKYRVKLPDKHNQYMVDSINLICEDVYNWL